MEIVKMMEFVNVLKDFLVPNVINVARITMATLHVQVSFIMYFSFLNLSVQFSSFKNVNVLRKEQRVVTKKLDIVLVWKVILETSVKPVSQPLFQIQLHKYFILQRVMKKMTLNATKIASLSMH